MKKKKTNDLRLYIQSKSRDHHYHMTLCSKSFRKPPFLAPNDTESKLDRPWTSMRVLARIWWVSRD